MNTIQHFDQDQLHYISKGAIHHQTLINRIDEALFNNPFNSNFVISSLPGLGKSYWYFGIDISIKKLPKPGEGAVEKNQLKKSPLRRLARSS